MGIMFIMAVIAGGAFLFVHFTVDDEFRRDENNMKIEGANFGKTTDQAGCLAEGLRRSKTVSLLSPFKDKNQLAVFVRSCLPESRPTENFCRTVPASYNFGYIEKWKTEQCEKAGLSEESTGCAFVFEQHIQFCSRQSK